MALEQCRPPRDFRFANERIKVTVVGMTLLLNGLSEDQQRELLAAGSPRSLKPRASWATRYCPADDLACGNGTIRTVIRASCSAMAGSSGRTRGETADRHELGEAGPGRPLEAG